MDDMAEVREVLGAIEKEEQFMAPGRRGLSTECTGRPSGCKCPLTTTLRKAYLEKKRGMEG